MTELIDYCRYRKKGLRRAWQLANMHKLVHKLGLVLALLLAACILFDISEVKAANAAAQAYQSAVAAIDFQGSRADGYRDVLVSCLNGRGLWINEELHLCSVANTRIRREDHRG